MKFHVVRAKSQYTHLDGPYMTRSLCSARNAVNDARARSCCVEHEVWDIPDHVIRYAWRPGYAMVIATASYCARVVMRMRYDENGELITGGA